MSESVRVGIVGLGRLGRRHAENLAFRVAGARLVAAASPIEAERAWAEASLGGVTAYSGLPEVLAHPGLDAVWLVTPTSLHADQVIACDQRRQARLLREAAGARSEPIATGRSPPRPSARPGGDGRLHAPVRSGLRGSQAQDRRRRIGQGLRHSLRVGGSGRPRRLLRSLRADLWRHLPRLLHPRHRPRALDAGRAPSRPRSPPQAAASCTRRSASAATSTPVAPTSPSRAARSRPSMCRERRTVATRRR